MKREDITWISAVFLIVAFLFSLPYIVGALLTPPGSKFLGLLRLKDDLAVYLSWIEQVRQGDIFFVNLFTSIKQQHPFFNFFPLLLGEISRLLHLSTLKIIFISRYIFALCLVLLLYSFLNFFLPFTAEKRAGLLILLFSSGIGWLTGGYSPARGFNNSVDLWQPESTIFFTLYVNPLFTFALIFILLFFFSLLKWRNWKGGIIAGICLLILANAHTYDVVIVGLVWIFFLISLIIKNKKILIPEIYTPLIALIIASPAIYHQIFLLRNEPLFSARAAVPTLSPPFYFYLSGMGFLIPLAIWGIIKRFREDKIDDSLLFLISWAIAGFILPYLPFSFQRKLFMGTQIPLAILSTIALTPNYINLKKRIFAFILIALFPSNAVILGTDIYSLITNKPLYPQPNYVSQAEGDALEWLKDYTTKEEPIVAIPDFACYIPALCGRRVYAGHWGETPNFADKYKEVLRFFKGTEESAKERFLGENGIKYVYYGNYERFLAPEFPNRFMPYLQPVYQNEEVTIWRVRD
jgi:hypothetical protein